MPLYIHTISYEHTQKLISLLTSIMATMFELLPGKRLALLKSLSYLCSLVILYLAIELYLLPCGRKRTALVPGSIAIITDLHKNSEQWVGPMVTSRHWQVREAPLVVIDRKPKLWLLILLDVGGAIVLI